MDNKERFVTLCRNVKRDGIEELLDWVKKSDFFTAPASTRFHGSYPGGLLQHSLNVYDELKRVLEAYPEIECSEESAIICALFHDFCKINYYTVEKRKAKNITYYNFNVYSFEVQKGAGGSHSGGAQPSSPQPAVGDGEVDDSRLPF